MAIRRVNTRKGSERKIDKGGRKGGGVANLNNLGGIDFGKVYLR